MSGLVFMNITKEEWMDCKEYFENSCAYCGMTQENHREKHRMDLIKEHVVNMGANNLSNCVPSCLSCNSSKKQKDLKIWYTKQIYYEEGRIKKINKWVEKDHLQYITNHDTGMHLYNNKDTPKQRREYEQRKIRFEKYLKSFKKRKKS